MSDQQVSFEMTIKMTDTFTILPIVHENDILLLFTYFYVGVSEKQINMSVSLSDILRMYRVFL